MQDPIPKDNVNVLKGIIIIEIQALTFEFFSILP